MDDIVESGTALNGKFWIKEIKGANRNFTLNLNDLKGWDPNKKILGHSNKDFSSILIEESEFSLKARKLKMLIMLQTYYIQCLQGKKKRKKFLFFLNLFYIIN